jgi:hypothetical protein
MKKTIKPVPASMSLRGNRGAGRVGIRCAFLRSVRCNCAGMSEHRSVGARPASCGGMIAV